MPPEVQNEEVQQSDAEQKAIIEKESKRVMAEVMGTVLEDTDVRDFDPPEDPPATDDKAADPAPEPDDKESDKAAAPSLEQQMQAIIQENQKLKRALDTTNGRYGNELQQLRARIDELNNASNLKKTISKLSIDLPAFKNIKEEYPEIGQDLINGFRQALMGEEEDVTTDTPQDPKVFEKLETQPQQPPASDASTKLLALEILKERHPDFEAIAGFEAKEVARGFSKIEWKNPEFGQWIEAMPDSVREVILNGGTEEDPSTETILSIRDVLTEFKNSQAAKTQTEKPQSIKPKPDLSRSLIPQGRSPTGKVSLTPDEIIEAEKLKTMKAVMNGY